MRFVGFAWLLVLAGCPGAAPERDGGSGGRVDARPASMIDAGGGMADAEIAIDARPMPDAMGGGSADAMFTGTPCASADGTQHGSCIDTNAMACTGTVLSGRCPGPSNIKCCIPPGGTPPACDESAMPTPNDGMSEEPGTDGCPAGMLRINDASHQFCIDRFEASLQLADGSSWSPFFNPGSRAARAVSLRGGVPQGYVSGAQAQAACAAAGKRLCTDTEWLRACRGASARTYPYGNTREIGVCNDHRDQHPAVELFGSVTNLQSPCINQLHDTVDPAGARTGCVTEDGVFDMMGNEHEWTAASDGTFRGGFYVDTTINGNGCLYVTTAHNSAYWDYSTGFRCCSD